jgi:hypothetical protein
LGWSDEHLNRFVFHGREYGVWHDGRIGFRDDPRHVRLANLGLRVRERFLYEYDFTDGWQHDVRLEHCVLHSATWRASTASSPTIVAGVLSLRRVLSARHVITAAFQSKPGRGSRE